MNAARSLSIFMSANRIRMRRALLNISQEKLAEAVGLTFQQIQKYERGMNRVSASRLHQFSKILSVPVQYFYPDFSESAPAEKAYGFSDNQQDAFMGEDLLYNRETPELLKIYYSVKDEKKRKELLKIIRSMVDNMGTS